MLTFRDFNRMGIAPNLMAKLMAAYRPSDMNETLTVQQVYDAVGTLDTVWVITACLPDHDAGLLRLMVAMGVHPAPAFHPTQLERVAVYTLAFRDALKARTALCDTFDLVLS